MPVTLSVVTATIAAGQSLSPAVDCGTGELVRFYMPPLWTPANLTFQMSPDNTNYCDLFSPQGSEFMINVTPGSGMVVDLQWRALAWLKFRSGTRDKPLIQSADRVFKLVLSKS